MSLIVKHFTNDEHDGGHDDRDILDRGKQVLNHACAQAGWVTVGPPSDAQLVCFQRTNNAYTYALKPPIVDLAFRDELLLDFDASKPVDSEEVIVLEDLEEFNHGPNGFTDVDNTSQEQEHPQLSTEDYSLFFQQHQPDAQSTPVHNNGTGLSSLDVSLILKQAESLLQQVPSVITGEASAEVSPAVEQQPITELPETTSAASGEGSHVRWEESLRNHSAFTPPDGWSQQDTPSMHPPLFSSNASQRDSHFFTGSQPPTGSKRSLSQSAVASEHPSNNVSFSLPPAAQAPRNTTTLPESTPPSFSFSFDPNKHHPSPSLPLPLPTPTPSHSQVQSQHRDRHATPSFSSQHPPTPTHNPSSLGSPIYSYSGPNREPTPSIPRSQQLEGAHYSSQYPRLYDPQREDFQMQMQGQPDAYMPLPEMGSLSLEAPSASQEGEGASQPSAYNDQPPGVASRVHPGDIVFASVAYNYSSATPPPPGQPPPPHSSSQPYPYFNVPVPSANHGNSESIENELGEIPGFNTRLVPPLRQLVSAREVGEADEARGSSSPIQDFTTSIIDTSARSNLNVQPVGETVGLIPGFGTRLPQHLVSSDARQEADEPRRSSSPIQDFTTSIVNARPDVQLVDDPVGPRWRFPSDVRLQDKPEQGRQDGVGDGARDVTSSSPILDFTTTASVLNVDLVGGGPGARHDEGPAGRGDEGVWRVPGLQQSPSQFLPQSHVREETGIGLGLEEHAEQEHSAVLKPVAEETSESVQIRTGEGAQPRETWSGGGSESLELYGNQQADDGQLQSLGVVGGAMDVDPPQRGGGEQKPLTRMSTDEQLYGSSGKSLPDLEPEDGGKTPTQEQPKGILRVPSIQLQRQDSSNSSKRSRSPDTRGASAHIQRVEEGTVSPPRKRRRLESGALYDLIPGPHLYTVPSPPATPAPKTLKLPEEANPKAYTALNLPQILPSSEHTPESVAKLFKDPYARCAWIVPVRGAPPFPGCTAASVLDTSTTSTSPSHPTSSPNSNTRPGRKVTDLPSGPTSNVAHQDSPGAITWTGDALRAFWGFLVDVREAGQMGPVALSFHCASSCYVAASKGLVSSAIGRERAWGQDRASTMSEAHSRTDGARLRDIDFFKVYVDAPYAPKMRDLLHAWRYECTVGGEVVRWRLLRGARFVLVDERSKDVLVW